MHIFNNQYYYSNYHFNTSLSNLNNNNIFTRLVIFTNFQYWSWKLYFFCFNKRDFLNISICLILSTNLVQYIPRYCPCFFLQIPNNSLVKIFLIYATVAVFFQLITKRPIHFFLLINVSTFLITIILTITISMLICVKQIWTIHGIFIIIY